MSKFSNMMDVKKKYNEYKRKRNELPKAYCETLEEIEKYMFNFAAGDSFVYALEDMLAHFEEGANSNKSITELIGDDPVEFAESIMAEYPEDLWYQKARNRLRDKVAKISHEM